LRPEVRRHPATVSIVEPYVSPEYFTHLLMEGHVRVELVQAKVQREPKWTRKSAISVHASEIAGTILSSTEPAIGNVAVVEPPLVIHDTQPQDPQPPHSPLHAPPGDLDFPLHPHPIVEPGPQPFVLWRVAFTSSCCSFTLC
jgi:hypothetical protein